ncbi:MAG: class I SAM-dependent methyltransferase [Planctomycetes bacterium]|nr:class I SAM-dependent methyltransferase [Planctomycetota bacterium]
MDFDRQRLSLIGHEGFLYWNPVSADVLDEWSRDLPLDANSLVLDVGCGRAELLVRLVAAFGCRGVGVDPNPYAIEIARAEAARRVPEDRIELLQERFETDAVPQASQDLAICLGSTQAFDGFESALWILRERVRPGGLLLLGEGFWRREPAKEYLEFLGCGVGDLHSHLVNLRLAEESGLEVLRARETTEAEWSAYEDRYSQNLLNWTEEHPDDPDAPGFRAHIEGWRQAYLEWGRSTLGFGIYLLQRPE